MKKKRGVRKLSPLTRTLLILTLVVMVGTGGRFAFDFAEPNGSTSSDSLESFNDGWKTDTTDGTEDVTLPGKFSGEDGITIYQDIQISDSSRNMLFFYNMGQIVSVSVDGTPCYQLNTSETVTSQVRADGCCSFPISGEPGTYHVEITIRPLTGDVCSLPDIYIGSHYAVSSQILGANSFTIVCILFLLLMSVLILCGGVYFSQKHYNDARMLCLAGFLFFVAAWAFFDSSLVTLVNVSAELMAFFCYIAFMLLPLPVIQFVCHTCEKQYRVLYILKQISFLNIIVQLLLASGGVCPLQNMLVVTHALIATVILCSTWCMLKENKEHPSRSLKVLIGSMLFIAFISVVSMLLYWLKICDNYRNVMLCGMVVFATLLVYILLHTYTDALQKSQMRVRELTLYEEISLKDGLTGLKNRRAYEDYVTLLENTLTEEQDALLIMLDLNGLKYTNDAYGHNAGDDLIVAAARAIEATFGAQSECYRIGGDEFTVIIAPFEGDAEEMIAALQRQVDLYNERAVCKLSVATGMSHLIGASGIRQSIGEWKQDADLKMYTSKITQRREIGMGTGEDFQKIVSCVIAVVEAKDPYTAHHSDRVCSISYIIARHLGLSDKTSKMIETASHLHDIGKIGIRDDVLLKQGKLSDEEYAQMKRHPVIGYQIISQAEDMVEIAEIVLHHHEGYDGSGYPDGLSREGIPIGARVVAIADSIDAMTSNRCYRKARSLAVCRREIEDNLGKKYDPAIGRITLEHWTEIEEFIKSSGENTEEPPLELGVM